MLDIALFGTPRFLYEGEVWTFGAPPKTLPLFVWLLLHRNVPAMREILAGVLWPDVDDETARANLRRHLHYLQRALPPGDWLIVDRKAVRLNAHAPFRFDVAEFEAASKLPEMHEAAVRLYTGDLYEGSDEEWLYFERERLRATQISNLTALGARAERARDAAGAERYARMLLALEPWREDAIRVIMRSRMQEGDRAGALAEYERFSSRLDEEMGVEPDEQTQALYETFARQGGAAPQPVTADPDLAGRAGEMEALLLQWRRAMQGQSAVTLIGGEAGIGKTRLVHALAKRAEADGAIVLAGRVSAGAQMPYEAITQALGRVRVRASGMTPMGAGTVVAQGNERGTAFSSIAGELQRLVQTAPVLLWIDDVHWAGADTIALIEFLARRMRAERIAIIATYRDDAIAPDHPLRAMRRALTSRPGYTHLALNALDRTAIESMALHALETRPDAGTIDAIYQRSGGNAFFATELLANLRSTGVLSVPQSVSDLVRSRIQSLSASTQELLAILAAAPRPLPPPALELIAGADGPRIFDELVRTRFLTGLQTPAGRSYSFVHDLVREAIYGRAGAASLQQAHRAIARALENAARESASAAIAWNYEQAGDTELAAEPYLRAAREAAENFANDDAELFAKNVLEYAADPGLQMQALEVLFMVYFRRGNWTAIREVVSRMDSIAEETGERGYALRALHHRLTVAFFDQDLSALQRYLPLFEAARPDEPLWHGRVHLFRSAQDVIEGDLDAAWSEGLSSLARCEEIGYSYGELFSCVWLLSIADASERPYQELLRKARQVEQDLGGPEATELLAIAETRLFLHVDRTACEHSALRLLEAAERSGNEVSAGIAHMYLAAVAVYRFEPVAAKAHFEIAQRLLSEQARRVEYVRMLRFRGLYEYNFGNVHAGISDSLEALRLARAMRFHELIGVAGANAVYGYLLLERSEPALALSSELMDEIAFVRGRQVSNYHLRALRGFALCMYDRFDEGLADLRQSYEAHRERGYRLHATGLGSMLAYQLARAGELAEAALYASEVANAEPDLVDEGYMPQEVLWFAAQAFRRAGDTARAAALLQSAAQVIAARSAMLPTEEMQQQFLATPLARKILRAHAEGVWPTL